MSALRSILFALLPAGRYADLRDLRPAPVLAAADTALQVHHGMVLADAVRRALDMRHPRARRRAREPAGVQPSRTSSCAKHSSTWETLALNFVCPPLAFVAKKELLSIPFFGWAFRQASPITIDRKSGSDAMTQIVTQGRERLTQGFWIVMYPEGTRIPRGHAGALQDRRRTPGARAWRPDRAGGA